jgi:hypothetical protein
MRVSPASASSSSTLPALATSPGSALRVSTVPADGALRVSSAARARALASWARACSRRARAASRSVPPGCWAASWARAALAAATALAWLQAASSALDWA